MRNIIIKSLTAGFLILYSLQLYAQQIVTRQDAISFFEKVYYQPGRNFSIVETNKRLDGVKEEVSYAYKGKFVLENEYIILTGCIVLPNNSGGYTCQNDKELLLNLTDSFTLEKVYGQKKTSAEKYYRLMIRYKDYIICSYGRNFTLTNSWVKTKTDRNNLDAENKIIENVYTAICIIKSTFDTNEKAELKLTKFRDEYLKTGKRKELSEEQRRYIVQANAANDAKDYYNALLLYRKSLDIDKFSYPEAYFNMALILAQVKSFYQATYAMKAYLVLAPDAEDARKAQDKIYEWELNIKF